MTTRPPPRDAGTGTVRLSAADRANLVVETPATPMHVGAVLVLDGGDLLAADGTLRLHEARRWLERRVRDLPELRRRLQPGGWPGLRPQWKDDPAFRIDHHVTHVRVPEPGDEAALVDLAGKLLAPRLDRARPLWRLWFVTGLAGGQVGLVIAVHHALADGAAALRLLPALLGPSADRPVGPIVPAAPPVRHGLLAELKRGWRTLVQAWGAPRVSLNAPVGPGRRIAVVRLELASAKAIGHAHGATVNDVVLDVVAGGLRALLATRGEAPAHLHVAVPVAGSHRGSTRTGNRSGVIVVRLPLAPDDPMARLRDIAATTGRAKREQLPITQPPPWFGGGRLIRWVARRQRLTNAVVSNVAGPTTPLTAFGARVIDIIPLGVLAGNLGLSFLAFSYAGQLTLTVCADAQRFPDLPVLADALVADWARLEGLPAIVPGPH